MYTHIHQGTCLSSSVIAQGSPMPPFQGQEEELLVQTRSKSLFACSSVPAAPPISQSFLDNKMKLGEKTRLGEGKNKGGECLEDFKRKKEKGKERKASSQDHNPRIVRLRVSWSQGGILTNNAPSWQTVQGCGVHLKKQQITQAPRPPGRVLARS